MYVSTDGPVVSEWLVSHPTPGLRYVSAERLYPHPDCGLKTRTVDETIAKCRVVVEATRKVRAELGAKVPA